jgi:hypothetical protein
MHVIGQKRRFYPPEPIPLLLVDAIMRLLKEISRKRSLQIGVHRHCVYDNS